MSGFEANDQALGRADGDGAVGPEEMGEIRRKILQWNDRAQSFFDKRVEGQKARHCLWRGQGPDGRLWAENNEGVTPTPFNGASDQRIRWADGIVLDKSAVLLTGLAAADVSVKAVGAKAGSLAGNLTVMLLWMIKNMGAEWYRQWKILASYYLGDSPAAAMMSAEWVREERMDKLPHDTWVEKLSEVINSKHCDYEAREKAAVLFREHMKTCQPCEAAYFAWSDHYAGRTEATVRSRRATPESIMGLD